MRRALLVANGAFEDSRIAPLASPVRDVERLAAVLRRADIGPYEVTLCLNLPLSELRVAVQRFFDAARYEDLVLLLLSSHGIKDRVGKLHFAARDTRFDALQATALDARFVWERIDESEARRSILLLDTCYSGAFAHAAGSKGVGEEVTRGDFGDDQSSGKVVITASTAVQRAFERTVAGSMQSSFTRHVTEGLASGRADLDRSGDITVDELYHYVRSAIRAEQAEVPAAALQTPQRWYFGLDGSVPIAKRAPGPAGAVADEALAAATGTEITAPDAPVESPARGPLHAVVRLLRSAPRGPIAPGTFSLAALLLVGLLFARDAGRREAADEGAGIQPATDREETPLSGVVQPPSAAPIGIAPSGADARAAEFSQTAADASRAGMAQVNPVAYAARPLFAKKINVLCTGDRCSEAKILAERLSAEDAFAEVHELLPGQLPGPSSIAYAPGSRAAAEAAERLLQHMDQGSQATLGPASLAAGTDVVIRLAEPTGR
jgi:Caspase domain